MIVTFAEPFQGLFKPYRYKVYYGGRGGAKSWAMARALLLKGAQVKIRVLCVREIQHVIADSVHKLLSEQVEALGLTSIYRITNNRIIGTNGTEFIFAGLRANVREIKSKEGVDVCWAEEAESVTDESWGVLIPTIRKPGSEIWVSFNPLNASDPTYQRFVVHTPPDTLLQQVSWRDNPWFPEVLIKEKDYLKRIDPDAYNHIWEGKVRTISNAVVFKDRFVLESFTTPKDVKLLHGTDWGFGSDPSTLVRCFVDYPRNRLYVDAEIYSFGIELDQLPKHFSKMDTARTHLIKADNSRPETIRFMQRRGFNISGAKKWNGSVEDGIAILKSFEKIVINTRCKHTIDEFRTYSYKIDKTTGEVLPVVVDRQNHCIDSIRYALDGYIRGRQAVKPSNKPKGY